MASGDDSNAKEQKETTSEEVNLNLIYSSIHWSKKFVEFNIFSCEKSRTNLVYMC